MFDGPQVALPVIYRLKQPDPGKTKIKEEYADFIDGRIVRKRLTGMALLFGNGLNYAIGPALENDNQVVNFVNNRYIEWLLDRNYLLAHASAIDRNGKGIAIAANSGKGKSTLALKLLNNSCAFVSNDRILVKRIDDTIDLSGIPKYPRINPGTILNEESLQSLLTENEKEMLKNLPHKKLWNIEQKYDVFIDEHYGCGKFTLSSCLKGVVILNWSHDYYSFLYQETNFSRRRDLLKPFMKSVGLFYDANRKSLPDLSEDAYLRHYAE